MPVQIEYEVDLVAFGERLQEERIRAGFDTQKALAEVMDVGYKYISRLEGGRQKPSLKFIIILGDRTTCDLNYILCGRRVLLKEAKVSRTDILREPSVQYGDPNLRTSEKGYAVYDDVLKALGKVLEDHKI